MITLNTSFSRDCNRTGSVNSRKPMMNSSTKLASSDGASSGNTTRLMVVSQRPPATCEASSSSPWICISAARLNRVVTARR
jgi:hypothetical protein